nr:MAG TPA: DNA-directed RNA polymerase [Caudoviricetes sp.]
MRDNPSTFWVSHQMADGVKNAERRIAALNLALSALRPVSREQVERVWPGCNRCKDPDTAIAWERWGHQYCSQCGRPLSPEAWEELRKRLEALNNGKGE